MINFLKKNRIIYIDIIFIFLSLIFECLKLNNFALITLIVLSLVLFYRVISITKNYVNVLSVFVGFHILYGLMGVIAYLWLGGFPKIYGTNLNIPVYLFAYTLATIGIIISLDVFSFKNPNAFLKINKYNLNDNEFLFFKYFSYILSFVTSLGELIDFFRVGGIKTLMLGKAIYQARVGDLFLTIPTNVLFVLSVSFLGCVCIYTINKNKKSTKQIIIFNSILLLPFLIIKIILGQRGVLLSPIILSFLLFSYYKPIKKVTKKIVLIALGSYLALSFLYITRPVISYLFTDINKFSKYVFSKNQISKVINPGSNEFSCGFGNFNTLYTSENYEFLYGKSYLNDMISFVPSFVYPGKKPLSITYQFRDTYFLSESKRSRIAGTAFSSILEAYWNFGFVGILVIYFIIFYILIKMYSKMYNCNIWTLILLFSFSTNIVSFHRSDFGDILTNIILKFFALLVIYLIFLINKKNDFKYIKKIKLLLNKLFKLKFFRFLNEKIFKNKVFVNNG